MLTQLQKDSADKYALTLVGQARGFTTSVENQLPTLQWWGLP